MALDINTASNSNKENDYENHKSEINKSLDSGLSETLDSTTSSFPEYAADILSIDDSSSIILNQANNDQNQHKLVLYQSQANSDAIQALLQRTGFPLVQENGQRKYGPPPNWGCNTEPDRGCEAFIGKIPRDCFEDEIVPLLERVGPIYEFRLMMEYSGYNRGYGFVMYTSREDAKRCVAELNNYEIRKGRMMGVCRSVDNCRLFVGGIPKNKKREEILYEMKKVTEDVVNVIVYPSAHDKTKNRGFAFVQYTNHRAAAIARRKLIPNRTQLFGQPIAVDWAEPEPEVDEDVMATVKVLYVRNLMLSTTEERIKEEFEKVTREGAIERVKKMKDFAFVHFKEREDALSSIQTMSGAQIDGSHIEVSLSKPVDKTNLLRLTRGTPSPTNGLDLGLLLGQKILASGPVLSIPILTSDSSGLQIPLEAQLAAHQNQNLNFGQISMQSDLNQLVNSTHTNTHSSAKFARTSRGLNNTRGAASLQRSVYYNFFKGNSGLGVLGAGTLKKQASSQDVPYDLYSSFNHVPVLPFNPAIQFINKPSSQILEELCKKEGFGSPVYTLHTTNGTDQDGREIGLYIYKVTISGLANGNQFCSNRLLRSIEEAKADAADFVLSQIYQQPQTSYVQSFIDLNEFYLQKPHIQTNSGVTKTAFPSSTIMYHTDLQHSLANINPAAAQNLIQQTQQQMCNGTSQSNDPNTLFTSANQVLTQQPNCQMTPAQYILDPTGQFVLYPTQSLWQ